MSDWIGGDSLNKNFQTCKHKKIMGEKKYCCGSKKLWACEKRNIQQLSPRHCFRCVDYEEEVGSS